MFKLSKLKISHFNTKPPEWLVLRLPHDHGEYCWNQTLSPLYNCSTDLCFSPQVATRATSNLAFQVKGSSSPPELSLQQWLGRELIQNEKQWLKISTDYTLKIATGWGSMDCPHFTNGRIQAERWGLGNHHTASLQAGLGSKAGALCSYPPQHRSLKHSPWAPTCGLGSLKIQLTTRRKIKHPRRN